jgi:hypothetical protein
MRLCSHPKFRLAVVAAGAMITGGLMTGTAMAYQGHMFNALHALENADAQLQEASANKGGHRENAINLVNQAIAEVKAGIAVGAE